MEPEPYTLVVLDTNILVHMVRGGSLEKRIHAEYAPLMTQPRPMISVVVDGELRSLSMQFEWGQRRAIHALFLLGYFDRVTIDRPDVLQAYAVIDSYSKRVGRRMGKNDLWIAATAYVTGAELLTTDNDFDHLDGIFLTVRMIKMESV
jgi:predicted nucleic acid-binding protein